MKILIINGPNINMLGIRERNIYGDITYDRMCEKINDYALKNKVDIEIFQSNHEGDLIDKIQSAYFNNITAIIINAGAYTHTSIAILDALKAVNIKVVEVHISDIYSREEFRHNSYISFVAEKSIIGHGINGYIEAIEYLLSCNYEE